MLNLYLSTHAAIDYLVKRGKAHCDISFNNILLRDVVDNDNDVGSGISNQQREIMEHMAEFRCRRGLLIDFDYSGDLGSVESASSRRTVCFFISQFPAVCFTYLYPGDNALHGNWFVAGTHPPYSFL